MNGPTHLAFGLAAAASLGANRPEYYLAVATGSLIADIDGAGAISRPLEHMLPRIVPKGGAVTVADDIAETGASLIRRIFGHRGFLHWPLLVAVVMVAGLVTHRPWVLWFSLGWLCHIYADALTVRGVPLCAPFDLSKINLLPRILLIKTGSISEKLAAGATWGYLAFLAGRFVVSHLKF
jgi:membrane-bound metal-dependent hydrolase YbcI (DUF457 family)